MTEFQDYLCGEGYEFLLNDHYLPENGTGIFTDGPHQGLQAHTNFIFEDDWVHDKLNADISPPNMTKEKFLADMQRGISRGIVPSVGLEVYQDGSIGEVSMEYFQALRKAIDA